MAMGTTGGIQPGVAASGTAGPSGSSGTGPRFDPQEFQTEQGSTALPSSPAPTNEDLSGTAADWLHANLQLHPLAQTLADESHGPSRAASFRLADNSQSGAAQQLAKELGLELEKAAGEGGAAGAGKAGAAGVVVLAGAAGYASGQVLGKWYLGNDGVVAKAINDKIDGDVQKMGPFSERAGIATDKNISDAFSQVKIANYRLSIKAGRLVDFREMDPRELKGLVDAPWPDLNALKKNEENVKKGKVPQPAQAASQPAATVISEAQAEAKRADEFLKRTDLKLGESEPDRRCAPQGTTGKWVVVKRGLAKADADYQRQITRTPKLGKDLLVEYVVARPGLDPVHFDGCRYWGDKALLDAKNRGTWIYNIKDPQSVVQTNEFRGLVDEVRRQAAVVGNQHPVEWNFPIQGPDRISRAAQIEGAPGANFNTVVTPPKP